MVVVLVVAAFVRVHDVEALVGNVGHIVFAVASVGRRQHKERSKLNSATRAALSLLYFHRTR
jgi:hypothetical protein